MPISPSTSRSLSSSSTVRARDRRRPRSNRSGVSAASTRMSPVGRPTPTSTARTVAPAWRANALDRRTSSAERLEHRRGDRRRVGAHLARPRRRRGRRRRSARPAARLRGRSVRCQPATHSASSSKRASAPRGPQDLGGPFADRGHGRGVGLGEVGVAARAAALIRAPPTDRRGARLVRPRRAASCRPRRPRSGSPGRAGPGTAARARPRGGPRSRPRCSRRRPAHRGRGAHRRMPAAASVTSGSPSPRSIRLETHRVRQSTTTSAPSSTLSTAAPSSTGSSIVGQSGRDARCRAMRAARSSSSAGQVATNTTGPEWRRPISTANALLPLRAPPSRRVIDISSRCRAGRGCPGRRRA